jgi:hypothetical protein
MNTSHYVRTKRQTEDGYNPMPSQSHISTQQELRQAHHLEVVSSPSQFPSEAFVADSGIATDGETIYISPEGAKAYLDHQKSQAENPGRNKIPTWGIIVAVIVILYLIK